MNDLSKYQDNPSSEPVKTGASPFRSLDGTCCRIEDAFRKKTHSKKINLNLSIRGQKTGSTLGSRGGSPV